MRRGARAAVCLLLFLSLCACSSYEARVEGTWQGGGSMMLDTGGVEAPAPFEGAEQWSFDGEDTAIATVDGRDVTFHYYMTDDTLTLNDGGEVSWGIQYRTKGDTLYIGDAEFTKIR